MTENKSNKNTNSETSSQEDSKASSLIKDADKKLDAAQDELAKLEAELKAASEKGKAKEKSPSESPASNSDNRTRNKPDNKSKPDAKTSAKSKVESEVKSQVKPEPQPSQKTQNKQENKNKKPFSWLGFFGFIFSLVAIAGVAYLWWFSQIWMTQQSEQQNQMQSQLAVQANKLNAASEQQIGSVERAIKQFQNQLSEQQQSQQRSNNFVVSTERELQNLKNRIGELGQSQPNTWLAAESLYLVNLAERRLLIEQDSDTAIQLLMSANIRLAAMQDSSVFYLRTAISEDIALLNSVTKPDTDTAYLTLSGLISQLQTLPFARKYTPDVLDANTTQTVSQDLGDWQDNLMASLRRFMGNFITVTRHETKVEPELPPKQKWYVRANITSQLIAAQHASLKQQQAIFDSSLVLSKNWLKQYFDLSDPAVVSAIITLEELEKQSILITLPASLKSQALIKNYVSEQLKLKVASGAENTTGANNG